MFDRLIDRLRKAVQWLPLSWLKPGRANASGEYLRKEHIVARLVGGDHRYRLLPFLDTYTAEDEEMRRQYRLMLCDPMVKSALVTKMLGVASLDLQVHPASERAIDREASDFIRYCLEKARGGLRAIVLAILFGGLIDGYSVCEKRFTPEDKGRWKGKWRLQGLKAKDTDYLWLVADEYRNLVAITDRRTAQDYNPSLATVFTHLELFSSPLGNSDLRAAYRAYWLRDTAWQLRAIGMERYSLPVLKGTYQVPDQKTELELALEQARSQTWVSLPAGAQVEALQLATSADSDFDAAIRKLDEDIVIAITGATLQMLQGQVSDGRGSSQVHKSTSELLVWYLAGEVGDVLTDQVCPELVAWNFLGADPPKVTLGGVDDGALQASADLDLKLQQLGLKLSEQWARKKYDRPAPVNDQDALQPAAPGAAPPAGEGFADEPEPEGPDPGQIQDLARGDSRAVTDLQESYHAGKMGRAAAAANAVMLLGATPEQAEALFPPLAAPPAATGLKAADSGVSVLTAPEKPLGPMPRQGRRPPTGLKAADEAETTSPKARGPAPAREQVAGPEADADKAERLLAASRRQGARTLAALVRAAAERLLAGAHTGHVGGRLFTDEERGRLAGALAASNSTAELLGRSRVRIRMERALAANGPRKFSDEPTDLSRFAEELEPLAPLRALLYFRSLVPTLGIDPADWVARQKAHAFTLAVATEKALLQKVQDAIARILQTGQGAGRGGETVGRILESAGVAPEDPQYGCFLPGTLAEGDILAASEARYNGPAVEIETDDGRRLRVTVNHPVLTPAGWKHAGDVQEGDDLVCYGGPVESLPGRLAERGAVNDQQTPARVEDVFQALLVKGGSGLHVQRPVAPLDFHGDAAFMDGEVRCVRADGNLGATHGDAERREPLLEIGLVQRNVAAAVAAGHCRGLLDLGGFGEGVSELSPVLLGDADALPVAAGLGPWAEAIPVRSMRLGEAANLDPRRFQAANKSPGGDAHLGRDLAVAFPGVVATHRVSKVKRLWWTGHVYDLQTRTGFIVSQGVVTSNSMVFRTNAMQAYSRGTMEEMQDPEVADIFPAWRYAAITDGRARPSHAARDGNLYASAVDFHDVRGRDISDVANCRCSPVPVSKYELADLRRAGPVEVRRFAEVGAVRLAVPFLPQLADYDCGAACLRMAAAFLGVSAPESLIAAGAGTNPAVGTQPEDLAAEARRLGLKASEGLTNERAVAAQLAQGAPVILLIQADAPERDDGGHYVVACGFDGEPGRPERFYVQDPIDGPWSMSAEELLARWHCQDETGRRDDRTAVAVWK